MSEATQIVDLDPQDFKMSDYDNVRITMPVKPALSKDDVDAQLFEYVISGGKHINSIDDLDDEWVQNNFDGLSTIAEVRQAIVDDYNRNLEFETADIKYKACCDALIERLSGEVDQSVLENNIEVTRNSHLAQLEMMHISMEQYLREEHMTQDQYESKLHDETLYQMRLNVALDIMADVLGTQVGNHEITEYLSAPNPEKFIQEIRENGQVENARRAAVRVKVMRRVVDTAIVTEEGDGSQPESYNPIVDDDDTEIPDFDNLPDPRITNVMPIPDAFNFDDIDLSGLKPTEN